MLYTKTEAGKIELQARAAGLTPSQRQVLILCDGERHAEDLLAMMPPDTLKSALERLVNLGLLAGRDVAARARPVEIELTEADRYRAIVELATSLAMDLGFTARVKAQLQIERANTVADLSNVVTLLCSHLTEKHKDTPLMSLRLNKLRQLAAA
ncbi:MAG: hypothetical protein HYX47_13725 [Burkholderiales bacterium]|nr:hypothetical protein [Burkholderiales bacterium]